MTLHKGPIEWPDLEQFSDTPVFNTKAVVQMTGITAPTLRAWERRYDLLSPERADNDYRLYSERDIALIRWLKECIDTGMPISQAIALFRHLSEEHLLLTQMPVDKQKLDESVKDPSVFQVTTEAAPPFQREEEPEAPLLHRWPQFGTTSINTNYPATHNMSLIQGRLIDAFRNIDEATATTMMGSMLAIYPVEQICTELITPTMWQVGQLWADGQITVTIEHFASNFFRALLTNLFHVTPGAAEGSLSVACCAPGEPHELGALMFALFLRRQNRRVAYLGQSIEISGLLHTIRKLSPVLVCISLTMPAYLPALINLATQVQNMAAPRPIFSFGGQVFTHYAHIIPQIPGVYLNGDLKDSVAQLNRIIMERSENKN